jgi:hypothetical protein
LVSLAASKYARRDGLGLIDTYATRVSGSRDLRYFMNSRKSLTPDRACGPLPVVVTGVEHYQSRSVAEDDPIEVVEDVGQSRATESAIENGKGWKI